MRPTLASALVLVFKGKLTSLLDSTQMSVLERGTASRAANYSLTGGLDKSPPYLTYQHAIVLEMDVINYQKPTASNYEKEGHAARWLQHMSGAKPCCTSECAFCENNAAALQIESISYQHPHRAVISKLLDRKPALPKLQPQHDSPSSPQEGGLRRHCLEDDQRFRAVSGLGQLQDSWVD